jgi:PAS domain S-box-containing protein
MAPSEPTAQDGAEAAVTRSAWRTDELHLRLALDAAHAGTFDLDVAGDELPKVTEGLRRLFGFKDGEEPVIADYVQRVHPADRSRVAAVIQQSIDTAQGHYVEYRIGDEDPGEIWVASHADVVRGADGRAARLIGFVMDISERKRAEEALRVSEARFRALADSMPQLVWTANAQGELNYYNARASEYGGIERLPDGTWRWKAILHPEDREPTMSAWAEAVATRRPYACEHRTQMADGSFRWHISRAQFVPDEHGGTWFGTATDIHERKTAEAALERAVATRDQVVSVVAHDFRSPLNVVRTFMALFERLTADMPAGELRQRGGQYLARLDRQVTRMEKLLDELLDVARLQAGQPLELERRRCDLVPLVRELVDEQSAGTTTHSVELRTAVPALVGHWDEARVQRVLENLLSNALKYSPAGTAILIDVSRQGDEAVVSVTDQGVGIPEPDRERIFDWYARGENAQRTARGTGVGLAGARRIVQQHGGTLTVESQLGRGSRFTLRLPLS